MANKDKNDREIARILDNLEYQFKWGDYTENEEVKKVLALASKNGYGNIGKPDHIYVNEHKKLLILVEDKPTIGEHTSGDYKEKYVDNCVNVAKENSKLIKKNKKKLFKNKKTYQPSKYAVDGVIWYISFFKQKNIANEISRNYFLDWRIIGIAVSGDLNEKYNHCISTFILLNDKIIEQTISTINNENDYINLFNNIVEEDLIMSITQSSKKINKQLRSIDSQERPILLSALMICLFEYDNKNIDNSFITQYKGQAPQTIANNIKDRVDSILTAEGITETKRKVIIAKLEFVQHDAILTRSNVLKDILDELRTNVISKFSIASNYDIIGRFYEEFLRFAGVANVKKGIVLTPHHITTLFTELIPIEADDVIFDACCGTGAFLIAGMNKLLDIHKEIQKLKTKVLLDEIEKHDNIKFLDVINIIQNINNSFDIENKNYKELIYNDNEKNSIIERISDLHNKSSENFKAVIIQERSLQSQAIYNRVKSNQLIGFENNPTMYSLAISNMIFRGDGKSQIFYEDYFSEDADDNIKKLKSTGIIPTIGFINPPYGGKDNKENPTKKEIQFLERLLNTVSKYAIMIAPLSTYFKDNNIRNMILKHNTLKCVINMPKDLFMPNAATNTAISVFEVGVPQGEKEVVFYDLKDDGFVLTKNKGRTDIFGKWEKIKEDLMECIENPKGKEDNIKLLTTKIMPNEEWLIYAHSDTDYSQLSEDQFKKSIEEYLVFKVKNELNLLDEDLSDIELINIIGDYYNQTIECHKCNKVISSSYIFCPQCGNKICIEEEENIE